MNSAAAEGVVKALSVRQPWTNLIAAGAKTVETRSWATSHRGDLLIVSSRRPNIAPAGFALAVVRLADCRPMAEADEEAACCPVFPGAWAWVLADLRRLRPFPVKGRLGLYDVDLGEQRLIFEPKL